MGIDWEKVDGSFERYDKFSLPNVDDSADVIFQDDGNFVSKSKLSDAGAKFPRDSYIFVVKIGEENKEWWVGAQAFSVIKQLKDLRDANKGSLKDAQAKIIRVSTETTETNYTVEKV